jgi:hypothetical protein
MKKITIIAILLFTSTILFAQGIEITPLYGYTISGKVDNYNRSFDEKDDMSFGGLLSVEFDRMSFIELSYLRTNTKGVSSSFTDGRNSINMGVEQYHVGALREFKEGKVIPFGKFMLGTTRYVQTSGGDRRLWLFSPGLGLGAKVIFSERIGLRLHTNLYMPLEFAGGGFFCGIGPGGSGCGTDIVFNVPLVHWDLGAGLIIMLPD